MRLPSLGRSHMEADWKCTKEVREGMGEVVGHIGRPPRAEHRSRPS